jgi:hypothetical protein
MTKKKSHSRAPSHHNREQLDLTHWSLSYAVVLTLKLPTHFDPHKEEFITPAGGLRYDELDEVRESQRRWQENWFPQLYGCMSDAVEDSEEVLRTTDGEVFLKPWTYVETLLAVSKAGPTQRVEIWKPEKSDLLLLVGSGPRPDSKKRRDNNTKPVEDLIPVHYEIFNILESWLLRQAPDYCGFLSGKVVDLDSVVAYLLGWSIPESETKLHKPTLCSGSEGRNVSENEARRQYDAFSERLAALLDLAVMEHALTVSKRGKTSYLSPLEVIAWAREQNLLVGNEFSEKVLPQPRLGRRNSKSKDEWISQIRIAKMVIANLQKKGADIEDCEKYLMNMQRQVSHYKLNYPRTSPEGYSHHDAIALCRFLISKELERFRRLGLISEPTKKEERENVTNGDEDNFYFDL